MNTSFPDKLVIQASGFGPAMTARQSIQRAKKVMLDLEMISPWRRPFSVSGRTKETGDMPIAADLSDFDRVVMRALQSYDQDRYYNEDDPDNWKLYLDSLSPYGFGETFSNGSSIGEYKNRVSVSLQTSGAENRISLDNSIYVVEIPFYAQGQFNAAWSEPGLIYRLFDYFIDNCDPQKCRVFSPHQVQRVWGLQNRYLLGWLNYTKDPKVAALFGKTGKAVPYRAGVLLKLGDDASALSDPKVDAELAQIGEMLRSAGVNR